jgi:precorrin-6B methylase 2
MRARRALTLAAGFLIAASRVGAGDDVPFLESPVSVVTAMLELAQVTDRDTVYDLGSGDGRIVIAAAARYGCRAVGIEFDAALVARSEEAARAAGVADRARFLRADFFHSDLGAATVVTMYLSPRVNRRLGPILLEQLAPGTRVVSHRYPIDGWEPARRIRVEGRPLFLYRVPARP